MQNNIYSPPQEPLTIVHHDYELLLVDKPSGLLSVPGKGEDLADCLIERVLAVFPDALLVHRLDRDTSGIMVFAMTRHAQRHLNLQFAERRVKKVYIARVFGRIKEKAGTVDLPLIVDWPNRPLQHVDHENGKPAITDWKVVKYEEHATRVRLFPQTGRTHQLRVHMREIGHVILGDPFYAMGAARDASRLMLHAESLRIAHPDGGKGLTFKAKCPF
ncbi:pseudouridine synthase [Marinosulfonomonas sp. PRT-SC04]|nr:pseudouridine synthase [Marinosulfonomonas sp. PRT-SC04]